MIWFVNSSCLESLFFVAHFWMVSAESIQLFPRMWELGGLKVLLSVFNKKIKIHVNKTSHVFMSSK